MPSIAKLVDLATVSIETAYQASATNHLTWPSPAWGPAAPGDVTVVDERFSADGMNRTAAMVHSVMEQGRPCTWLCGGETPEGAATRLLAAALGIDVGQLRRGRVPRGLWSALAGAVEQARASLLFIEHLAPDVTSLITQVSKAKGLLVVDRIEVCQLGVHDVADLVGELRRRRGLSIVVGDGAIVERLAALSDVHVRDGAVVRTADEREAEEWDAYYRDDDEGRATPPAWAPPPGPDR
jgi:hypothetical protein